MSQPRVRLFIALELPRELRESLGAWGSRALSGRNEVRRLGSDHLHLTLCFLGWQPEEAVDAIAEACRSVADAPRGRLTGGEPIWLPPRRPRVLAIRLADQDGRVVQLQSRLSDQLADGGWYVPERRPYLPHVTVARIRARTTVGPFALPNPPALSFAADRITLFRSHLRPSGAEYEGLVSVELG